jgi:GT2 family glycosyltransferase
VSTTVVTPIAPAFPASLEVRLLSRRPSRLPDATMRFAMELAPPRSRNVLSPRISILVLTHNQLAFTKLCMATLVPEAERSNAEIVIVDNASTDGTAAYLRELQDSAPLVRVIFNSTNTGFPAANNQAAAVARGEILLLLNNDTLIAPGTLDQLCEPLCNDPSIALIGPVTNRTCNEAEITGDWHAFGQFLDRAALQSQQTELSEIPMLAMFCVAMRRSVFDTLGPLDERFELGMFEDEDYCMRARAAGLRVICHEGVLVHHFGESSFGSLVPDGTHARIFEHNKRVFDEKWNRSWRPHARRADPARDQMLASIRDTVAKHVPIGSTLAVISKGDHQLLSFDHHHAAHFSQDRNGNYSGHHPADGDEVRSSLRRAIEQGANFLLVPAHSFWWIDFYTALHPVFHAPQALVCETEHCRIFRLPEVLP